MTLLPKLSDIGQVHFRPSNDDLGPLDTESSHLIWHLAKRPTDVYRKGQTFVPKMGGCEHNDAAFMYGPDSRTEDNMFHLHARYLSKDGRGSAEGARQYLAREGRYAMRGDTVRWVMSLNMPAWAATASAEAYWRAAISSANRENARTAHLLEFAIPKLLPIEGQNELALSFATEVAALATAEPGPLEVLPCTMGFHEGFGRNPHLHLLVSTSIVDGLDRNAEDWFRRFNTKNPSKGGARRSVLVKKKGWLFQARELWASMANRALAAMGHPATLDHRSHTTRGVSALPGLHLGPKTNYLRAKGVSTPRSERQQAIVESNATRLELDKRIRRREATLARISLEIEVGKTAVGVWKLLRTDVWRHLLSQHPFAAPAPDLRRHATAYVFEADGPNSRLLSSALDSPVFRVGLINQVGVDWDATAATGGLWLVRPIDDSVVLIGQGYAATDGTDKDSIAALVKAASRFAYVKPVVAVRRVVMRFAEAILLELGVPWKVSPLSETEPVARKSVRGRL